MDKYFIIRTSWLFGINGDNFINKIIKLAEQNQSLNVVCDQIGSPTYTSNLAYMICNIIETTKYGVYHVTNEGFYSWADLAKEVFKLKQINCKVNPIYSSEYKTIAKRPLNSKLSKNSLTKNGFELLPHWKEALKRYLLST